MKLTDPRIIGNSMRVAVAQERQAKAIERLADIETARYIRELTSAPPPEGQSELIEQLVKTDKRVLDREK